MTDFLKHTNGSTADQLFGLIGYPLSHSFSKQYFTKKFRKESIPNTAYELFPLTTIDELPVLLQQYPSLHGLNVTIPYKEQVLEYLDEVDVSAEKVGAVNTIHIRAGKIIGFNTDVYGFEQSLVNWIEIAESAPPHKALILGSGGAAKAVAYVLRKLGIPFQIVSRTPGQGQLSYASISPEVYASHKLIVNTTPLGMFPLLDACPAINFEAIGPQHFLYDLIYNPEKTVFLSEGERKGGHIKNGLEMLHLQAERAWEIWSGDGR